MNQEKIWAYFQNEGAASFEAALPRYIYLRKRLKKVAKPNAKILNIGVGSGKLENLLQETGYQVSALDPDTTSIEKLISMGVDAQVGLVQSMPFQDESFDAVVASEVLEHLGDEECKEAIAEIRRVLKSGGHFIGTVPYAENLADNLTVCPHCGEHFHRWGHLQSFRQEELSKLLETQLELIRLSKRAFVVWSFRPLRLLKSSFRWLLGRLGEQIASPHFYFECRKSN